MSASADALQCFSRQKQPVVSLRLIHGVYQSMEASPSLIASQGLWNDQAEEAPSGWGQSNGSRYQIMACCCIKPLAVVNLSEPGMLVHLSTSNEQLSERRINGVNVSMCVRDRCKERLCMGIYDSM